LNGQTKHIDQIKALTDVPRCLAMELHVPESSTSHSF
jgi:hypothetical protein